MGGGGLVVVEVHFIVKLDLSYNTDFLFSGRTGKETSRMFTFIIVVFDVWFDL